MSAVWSLPKVKETSASDGATICGAEGAMQAIYLVVGLCLLPTVALAGQRSEPLRSLTTAVLAAVVNSHCNKRLDAYSITSSARSWIAVDRSTPIALAVLRLIASSNFTGC